MRLTPTKARALKKEFLKLLDQTHEEQKYQEFLESNPQLIPREFIQNHGLHFDMVFRKLALAKDYITDYFYLAKSSADWNCVLVEIEKPSSRFFKSNSNEFHPNFLAALSQINRWRAWFENSSNKDGFINGTIKPVRVPRAMTGNPCYIKYVLVHGRRSEFENNEHRAGVIRAHEREDFKILSFDSLVEDIQNKNDAYICVRKNEFIDIVSDRYVSDTLFAYMDTSTYRLSSKLKDSIEKSRSHWFSHSTNGGMLLDHVLPNLNVSNA